MALSRSVNVAGTRAGQAALIRSIACTKEARSCSSTSRCDALGPMARSIRSINASASAAAEIVPQRSADESGAFAGGAASLTWLAAGRLRLVRGSSSSEAANAAYTMES